MITKKVYVCDICEEEYTTEHAAIMCERQGLAMEYPTGCVYADHTEQDKFNPTVGTTYAVAKNNHRGHENKFYFWACMEVNPGELYVPSRDVASTASGVLAQTTGQVNPTKPHFIAMVNWLKSENIPITVWDGEKPIPYEEFMANYK